MKTKKDILRRVVPVDWSGQNWPVTIRRKPARHFPHQLYLDRGNAWPRTSSALLNAGLGSVLNPVIPMNTRQLHRFQRPQAFTLIEMLVVIAIIAILAGILLPTLSIIKTKARIKQAQTEMANLAGAIKAYETEYNRFPGSKQIEQTGADFTYGAPGLAMPPPLPQDNSLVMFILLNHVDQAPVALDIKGRNPRNLSLFDAKMVETGLPGIGTGDHVFRDPFGNPYIITIDVSGDDKCVDLYYKSIGGPGFTGTAPNLEFSGDVMIWSFGPDKKFGPGFDKDNILSWKQ